jgi:hypothetical protein
MPKTPAFSMLAAAITALLTLMLTDAIGFMLLWRWHVAPLVGVTLDLRQCCGLFTVAAFARAMVYDYDKPARDREATELLSVTARNAAVVALVVALGWLVYAC